MPGMRARELTIVKKETDYQGGRVEVGAENAEDGVPALAAGVVTKLGPKWEVAGRCARL